MKPHSKNFLDDLTHEDEAIKLVRSTDWSKTSLGPIENWPKSLKTIVSMALENPSPMFIFWGKDLVKIYNNASIPILGLKHPSAMGETAQNVWSEVWDQVGPLFEKVFHTGKPIIFQDQPFLLNRYGHLDKCFFSFAYSPLRDDKGNLAGVLDTFSETTETVLNYKTVEAKNKQLKLEKELRIQFISTLSHDLRNPITAAKFSAQMIARKTDQPDLTKLSSRIVESLNRADGMIQDLLDVSLLRAGEKIPLKLEECDLTELMNEVIEELTGIHGDRFILRCPQKVTGIWDRNGLRRMFENLANNAIKYGSSVEKVTMKVSQSEDEASVCVHNYGNPISPEDLPFIFNRFARTDSAIKTGQPGWGLGLSLVSAITDAHGGKAKVQSSRDEGTTFTIELPLRSSEFKGPDLSNNYGQDRDAFAP